MASMGDMAARWGMLIVETIAKVRRAYFIHKKPIKIHKKPIKAICREFCLSRRVVRKVIRSEATEFHYERRRQPLPRIDPWREQLDALWLANEETPARERLTLMRFLKSCAGSVIRAAMTRSGATRGCGAKRAEARRRKPMFR